MKIFWIFCLLVMTNIGVVVGMDYLQSIPSSEIWPILTFPFELIGGEEEFLISILVILLFVSHKQISNSIQK